MIIVLKRFEIDYETMESFKVNDWVEFPINLEMSKYTAQFLAKKDLKEMMDQKNISYNDLDAD